MTQPNQPTVNTDDLPPTQYLILEVLAARYRTGETYWTFPAKLRPHMAALERLGLIGWKTGVEYGTVRAWFTEQGRSAALSPTYDPPSGQWEWAIRFNSLRGGESILPRDSEDNVREFYAEPAGTENTEPVRRWVGPWQTAPTAAEVKP